MSVCYRSLIASLVGGAALHAVCDLLERRLDAERGVLPGAQHNAQRAPGFNETLARFLSRG